MGHLNSASFIKSDGSIRICGDFKRTINRSARTKVYPLLQTDELFASLSGGQTFTTLDLSHAYLQLELEESQELVTINTYKGLYKYTRLLFGVASTPTIFQWTMESLLQGLPMVCVYIDDIIILGKTPEEYLLHNLNEVLQYLESVGLCLKKRSVHFVVQKLTILVTQLALRA